MEENLFSYGTLQKENVQLELFGRLLKGTKDVLKGYKVSPIELKDETFSTTPGETYLVAIPSHNRNDSIEGVAYEMTPDEILLADRYEPEEYKRISVVLESGKNAWIYISADL